MKSKMSLLPRMAVNNIRKNGSTYFPYIGVSCFAMFTYFVFDLIQNNDIMHTLPKAVYAVALVTVGFFLLGLIMFPFLYYTNSFLIKRRKREIGLYSILGMEKKHIGIMMFWESLILYFIVMAVSLAMGLVFSKLIFLLLLNLAKLPVDIELRVSLKPVTDTLFYYALVTGFYFIVNLIQVGRARPVELMNGSRKGEKEPKHIAVWTVLGLLIMGWGYYVAVTARLDSYIFTNFFLAVFLVVIGTYLLFTSGSIALLRFLKRKKSYYYRQDNFVTISGMLYRMKKNAASLSNICIFSTMVMITVICTVGVWLSTDSIIRFNYPRDMVVTFQGRQDEAARQEMLGELAETEGVAITDYLGQEYVQLTVFMQDNLFRMQQEGDRFADIHRISLMTLEAYNRMEETDRTLSEGEALIFCSGPDFGFGQVDFDGLQFQIKEELQQCRVGKKAKSNTFSPGYLLVLPDDAAVQSAAAVFGTDAETARMFRMAFTPEGGKDEIDSFAAKVNQVFGGEGGFAGFVDSRRQIDDTEGMYGGLLFIGIFFGLIFLICLLISMYYKQITEGFEDQKNFEIMQKVGLSDEEIRGTIKRQILLVFALPLACAVLHTAAGMNMVIALLAAIGCFEVKLLIGCTAAVCLAFAILYTICYKRTSRAYYHIVKQTL